MEFLNEVIHKSAIDYARKNNYTDIVELLSKRSNKTSPKETE